MRVHCTVYWTLIYNFSIFTFSWESFPCSSSFSYLSRSEVFNSTLIITKRFFNNKTMKRWFFIFYIHKPYYKIQFSRCFYENIWLPHSLATTYSRHWLPILFKRIYCWRFSLRPVLLVCNACSNHLVWKPLNGIMFIVIDT